MTSLEFVRKLALEVYTEEGVEIWLHAPNVLLEGRSPASLIDGDDVLVDDLSRVLNLLDALASGAVL